jgi:hypothetical protein
MSEHTPGPWKNDYSPATGFGCGYGKSQILDSKDRPLAAVAAIEPEGSPMYDRDGLTQATLDLVEANARLIAAAPKLLAALEHSQHALVKLLASRGQDAQIQARLAESAAREAIAEAKGEPCRS